MTTAELEKLKADILAVSKQLDADDQSLSILQANLVLAMDQTRRALSDCRAAVVRLEELDKDSKASVHRVVSLRSAMLATMDYLDRVDPITS